jgi:hypothetical protein
MRNFKMLSLLSALLLLLALPVAAQMPEEQPEQQPVEDYEAEPIEPIEESEPVGDDYDVSAEVETDEQTVEGEVSIEDEDEGALPRTASPLALATLLGLAGIGAARGVRYLRRK